MCPLNAFGKLETHEKLWIKDKVEFSLPLSPQVCRVIGNFLFLQPGFGLLNALAVVRLILKGKVEFYYISLYITSI